MSSEWWHSKYGMLKYELRAQFMPMNTKDTKTINNEIFSNYSGVREVVIRSPGPDVQPLLYQPKVVTVKKPLKSGFFGNDSKECSTTVELEKTHFTMGEQFNIKVFSDNTLCDKPLEQLQVCLRYKVNCTANHYILGEKTREIGPTKEGKGTGQVCPAKEKFQQSVSFTIPKAIDKCYVPWRYSMPWDQGSATDHQRAQLSLPCPSYYGPNVKVDWAIVIYIKHNSWNETGDGMPIEIPVTISQGKPQGESVPMYSVPVSQPFYTQIVPPQRQDMLHLGAY